MCPISKNKYTINSKSRPTSGQLTPDPDLEISTTNEHTTGILRDRN